MTYEEAKEHIIPCELVCEDCGTVCEVEDTECSYCGEYVDFSYYVQQIEELLENKGE